MKLAILVSIFVFVLGCVSSNQKERVGAQSGDLAEYHQGQKAFQKKHYLQAAKYFEGFLKKYDQHKVGEEYVFWSLNQLGSYYLRVKRDPSSALKLFNSYKDDKRLNAAQQDAVEEWISACHEWKDELRDPADIKDPKTLFDLGQRFYKKGLKRKEYPKDEGGDADFSIALTYLRPLLVEHDSYSRIDEALLMMGRIRYNLQTDHHYWSENFFLKEAIRRFPGTKVSVEAFKALNESVRFGYTGSSGDNTPPSVKRMLKRYKTLAHTKRVTIKKKQ